MKNSRIKENVSVLDAYSGPSCSEANIPLGKIYFDIKEAELDALKLTEKNPVGFTVIKLKNNNCNERSYLD